MPWDYFAMVDFEATCWLGGDMAESEIIEFPVVLLDARTGKVAGEFHRYAKPVKHQILSHYCTSLTGITQDTVNAASTFNKVVYDVLAWLKEKASGADVLFVADGTWDMQDILPKQWAKSCPDEAYPEVFENHMDLRDLFLRMKPVLRVWGKGQLHQMCRHLDLEPEGQLHSGIDDTRNLARIMQTLMKEKHMVRILRGIAVPAHYKAIPAKREVNGVRDVRGILRRLPLECMALLVGSESWTGEAYPFLSTVGKGRKNKTNRTGTSKPSQVLRVEQRCKGLKMSTADLQFVSSHAACLGHVPDCSKPGEVRRFLVAFGQDWAEVQLRLERAWTEADEDNPGRQEALERLSAVEAAVEEHRRRRGGDAPKPLLGGQWLIQKTQFSGFRLGRLKEWLYYEQIDRDLTSMEEMENLWAELRWKSTSVEDMPSIAWPPASEAA